MYHTTGWEILAGHAAYLSGKGKAVQPPPLVQSVRELQVQSKEEFIR